MQILNMISLLKAMLREKEEGLRTLTVMPNAVLVEDGNETQIAPYDRQFASKTLGQRAMAIFAGPMMNFVLAFVVFIIIALWQGVPSDEPKLGKLTDDGAAVESGLKQGDIVHSINGGRNFQLVRCGEVIRKNPRNKN